MPSARVTAVAACLLSSLQGAALAVDLASMWNFSDPEASEQRFRAALATSSGDDALILQTQIARSHGLRRDFARARALLDEIEPQVRSAGAEVRVRHALELGRTLSSGAHAPESQTPEVREQARAAYMRAIALAKAEHLDGLAIDGVHMLAFVDTTPADQLKWGEAALEIADDSSQPEAKAWEASLRNNVGYALHLLGRYPEALLQFQRALELRLRGSNADATRSAQWMVAWTLRALGRANEALELQLALEADADAAGQPDAEIFDELEALYLARGDAARAAHYADRRKALAR
jgi:tetratricopeptide (TPR) repeat protein